MSIHSFSNIIVLCLLLAGVNASGNDQEANSIVRDALSKIRDCSSYRLARSLEAELAPGSSGAMMPVKISENAVLLVVRVGDVTRAHETSTIRECIAPLRFFSRGNKETKTTVWDGSWIYSWGPSNSGTKMVDVDINRGAAIVETLYAAILKDDSLRLCGEEAVDGQSCALLESSAEILTSFLYIPGRAMILLNKNTGFPMKISVQNQKSKATVDYATVETAPVYRPEIFNPPTNLFFESIQGQE